MRKYIFFLSVILMGACQSSAVFEKYEEQPNEVWNRYHIVEFTANIPDLSLIHISEPTRP